MAQVYRVFLILLCVPFVSYSSEKSISTSSANELPEQHIVPLSPKSSSVSSSDQKIPSETPISAVSSKPSVVESLNTPISKIQQSLNFKDLNYRDTSVFSYSVDSPPPFQLVFIPAAPSNQQPSWFLIASPILVILSMCLSTFYFWKNRYFQQQDKAKDDEKKTKERHEQLADDFWFRSIVVPQFSVTLKSFCEKHIKIWSDLGSTGAKAGFFIEYFDRDLQRDTHELYLMVDSIAAISHELSQLVSESSLDVIDALEQEIVEICLKLDVEPETTEISDVVPSVIKLFQRFQFRFLLSLKKPHEEFLLSRSVFSAAKTAG